MTVTATTRVATFPGDDTTGPFTFNFRVLGSGDITVTHIASDGTRTTYTNPTHYSISLVDSGLSGGSITLVSALATGTTLLVEGNTPLTQPVAYANQGRFYPENHETSFDRLTLIIQEVDGNVDRSLKLTADSSLSSLTLPDPTANTMLMWNPTEDGIINSAATSDQVSTVATAIANVNTVAGISANVTTVAGISADVTTVAGISTDVENAEENATLAGDYATKTDGYVTGTDNSAKSWAIGGTGDGAPTAGNAKDWATKAEDSLVDGSGYSALHWAAKAAASAASVDGTSIQDADNDTLIEVERTADDDTIYLRTAGADRVTITATGMNLNTYSINNAVIGDSTPLAGTFTTLNSTGGAVNGTVGATTPAAGTFTDLELSGKLTEGRVTANTGSSYTVNLSNGTVFELTLTANCTFTFPSAPGSGEATSFLMFLKQDGTGGRTTTWPSSSVVYWDAGTAPTLVTTVSAVAVIPFVHDGTRWHGGAFGTDFQ